MAKPTDKAPEIEDVLEKLAGRTTAITGNKCVKPPFGCGGDATHFRDPLFLREYSINGLCQKCQDKVFGNEGESE